MFQEKIIFDGKELTGESKVLIMLHGRGGSAADILTLSEYLDVKDFTLLAPQAKDNTWYPYSFMAPPKQNEPQLSSALQLIKDTTGDLLAKGIAAENIYFLGFSQGACLAAEFVAQNARKYGGVVLFTGGLIGDKINRENYHGNFDSTPVLISTGDPDFHVPVDRVYATSNILEEMGAQVTEKVYANRPHTITGDELRLANEIVFGTHQSYPYIR